ncbi:MAG: dihydrolipoyl dehydrogenase [Ruminococcaceae bacterium]|nr:dihydrolipoyl dehydrogenase [Oscillospiraceae bacterium]
MKITVIGSGPGGYETAIYAAKCGAEAVLIEKGSVGGTCLNVGCIPTKALLAASDAMNVIQKSKEFAITLDGTATQDYAGVIARKDKVVTGLVSGVEYTLNANGVKLVRGFGSVKDKNTVVVKLTEGGEEEIKTDAIILATGSVPTTPGFLPVDGETIITSNEMLSLTTMPKSMIIIGGGVIGCEIGQFLARMGSEVTIVEMLPHLLPPEDEDTAKVLEKQFRKEKIKSICGNGVSKVEKVAGGVKATLGDGTELEAEKMLVAIGRRPYTENLGLENVGIELNERGFVPTDDTMKTKVDGIYAIGDITTSLQLAHVASKEGFVAVDNILGNANHIDYTAIPRCVYTEPEIASVGTSEQELKKAGTEYKTGTFSFMASGKAKTAGKTDGFCKVIVDTNDVIIGGVVVGAHATDMIQILTIAVHGRMTAHDMGQIIFPHPTMSEGIMEAVHDVHGKSVHKV